MYLFAIVGTLVAVDVVFLIPTTAVSGSRLRREYEEMDGDNVSTSIVINTLISYLMCYMIG